MTKFLTFVLTLTATAAAVFFVITLATSAGAQDKKARPQKPAEIVVEYFCCDADGTCLPATQKAICPGGYTKVVNKTCEKGERGCDL